MERCRDEKGPSAAEDAPRLQPYALLRSPRFNFNFIQLHHLTRHPHESTNCEAKMPPPSAQIVNGRKTFIPLGSSFVS